MEEKHSAPDDDKLNPIKKIIAKGTFGSLEIETKNMTPDELARVIKSLEKHKSFDIIFDILRMALMIAALLLALILVFHY